MKFIDFTSKNRKNTIELLLILAVVGIVFAISLLWSVKPEVYARDFLPENTVFYYEFNDIDNLSQDKYGLFDYSVPMSHAERINEILAEQIVELEGLIWFKVENVEESSYLIKLSDYTDGLLESLRANHPDLYYNRLSKDILLISELESIANNPTKVVVGRFNVNYIAKGINIYVDLRHTPEFLQKLTDSLSTTVSDPRVFINLSDNNINIYQTQYFDDTNKFVEQSDLYTYARQPKDFDFAIGTSQDSTLNFRKFISQNILLAIFDSLPYHNLSLDDLETYFLEESIVWQREDAWLTPHTHAWQRIANQFAKTFEVSEHKKLLPDGTLYIEYVESGTPAVTQHQYHAQSYWQIDGLHGWQVDLVYYLSNDEDMIKEIIDQGTLLGDSLADCSQGKEYYINDFMILDPNELPEGDLRAYLNSKNIKQLNMFGYFNHVSTGILICE